jgi:hypothetical protein
MSKYVKYILAIFLAVAFSETNAQIKPGYIFGLNLSTITLKSNSISTNPSMPAGIHLGVFLEIPVRGNFTFQPALVFSAKGADYAIDSVDISMAPTYMEVPLIAVYSFGSDAVKISLFAGPYFAGGIGGYKIVSGGPLQDLNFGSGENDDLKFFDIGLNFGAGVNIGGLFISAQYGIGLANISPGTTDDLEMKNKVIGISISSLFAAK